MQRVLRIQDSQRLRAAPDFLGTRGFFILRCLAVLIAGGCLLTSSVSLACPNCPSGLKSYSEHVATSDAVVLAEWVAAVEDSENRAGSTTVRVLQVVKGASKLAAAKSLKLDRYRSGKKGDLFLVFATVDEDEGLVWNDLVEVNAESFKYIQQAPSLESDAVKRLGYFVKFLEASDNLIANDAFAEFANCEYKDLITLAPKFPREKLGMWIGDASTPPIRLGLYATMLGLCGNAEDARILESRILNQEAVGTFRLGLDGMISGYLMIRGDAGLELIDEKFLRDKSAPFSETYAAAQGLRFMWTYSDKISHARLRQSMRILLSRTEMADLVIADLARWKDWSIQEKLVKLYGLKDYNTLATKRAIIRFLLVCSKQPVGKDRQAEEHVQQALAHLAQLRQKDPTLVAETERFFIVP